MSKRPRREESPTHGNIIFKLNVSSTHDEEHHFLGVLYDQVKQYKRHAIQHQLHSQPAHAYDSYATVLFDGEPYLLPIQEARAMIHELQQGPSLQWRRNGDAFYKGFAKELEQGSDFGNDEHFWLPSWLWANQSHMNTGDYNKTFRQNGGDGAP